MKFSFISFWSPFWAFYDIQLLNRKYDELLQWNIFLRFFEMCTRFDQSIFLCIRLTLNIRYIAMKYIMGSKIDVNFACWWVSLEANQKFFWVTKTIKAYLCWPQKEFTRRNAITNKLVEFTSREDKDVLELVYVSYNNRDFYFYAQ